MQRDSRFRVIQLARNFRMDGGLTAGLEFVDSDAVVLMTADLQDPPEMIQKFVAQWEAGYENVYGIVTVRRGTGRLRTINSRLFYWIIGRLTGHLIPANASDFRLLDRRVYEVVRTMDERNRFVRGLVAWVGFRSTGVEHEREERFAGESKAHSRGVLQLAVKAILAHSQVPLVIIPLVGVGLFAISILALVALTIDWATRGVPFPGFGTIVALMVMLFGILFCLLGIVSIYMGQIYEEVKGRPNFVVRQTLGFPEAPSLLNPARTDSTLQKYAPVPDHGAGHLPSEKVREGTVSASPSAATVTTRPRGYRPISTLETIAVVVEHLTQFEGRSILVTGHTGFKGSWLALWLHRLGAKVTGYALDPPSNPNNFHASQIREVLVNDVRGDIRDAERMLDVIRTSAPDVVFHLAAQPIVRTSLVNPREAFDVNVVGTASLLDAVRFAGRPCAVVVITSDKCYRNDGQVWGFRENDPLGGHDPYSASKAGSELVVDAYRSSFFAVDRITEHGVRLASARAGNVIGGGDWADDRIVPDAVRALASGVDLVVRNPESTRPWQHVLEPLSGYLALAGRLLSENEPARWAEAWNFGPAVNDEATVADLATALVEEWGSGRWTTMSKAANIEAKTLRISIDKAVSELAWKPALAPRRDVSRTVQWYRRFYQDPEASMQDHSLEDITAYEASVP